MKKLFALLFTLLLIGCSSEPPKPYNHQLAADNAAKGIAFLEKNATQEGVITLPSGLQYRVIKAGDGPMPGLKDHVTVHYRGTTIDGTEFDSSYGRGNPMIFQVNRVVPGWTEALQLMKKGAKWQLFIPENLAYGARGAGDAIGPKETLIFEVELLLVH